jgi:hypothetical protein
MITDIKDKIDLYSECITIMNYTELKNEVSCF